jgi:hypothetical protein
MGRQGRAWRLALATAGMVALGAAFGSSAFASSAVELKRPKPDWYTAGFHKRVLAAGAKGVRVSRERLNIACPGYAERGVGAAGCIVAPYGCTAGNIFTDGASKYVGTARHCVDVRPFGGSDVGRPLVMQVSTTTVAQVGTVVKHTPGEGDPGLDAALVKLEPGVVSKWGVRPRLPMVGGPNGVYTGCTSLALKHIGHGYGAAVSQAYPRAGAATVWLRSGYGWVGQALFGDSGSPVVLADGRSAGNLTHLIADSDYLGADIAGMRMTAMLQFFGSSIRLVNASGGTSRSGAASCARSIL